MIKVKHAFAAQKAQFHKSGKAPSNGDFLGGHPREVVARQFASQGHQPDQIEALIDSKIQEHKDRVGEWELYFMVRSPIIEGQMTMEIQKCWSGDLEIMEDKGEWRGQYAASNEFIPVLVKL